MRDTFTAASSFRSNRSSFKSSPTISEATAGVSKRRSILDAWPTKSLRASSYTRSKSMKQRLQLQRSAIEYMPLPTKSPGEMASDDEEEDVPWGQQVLDSATFMNTMAVIILLNGAVIGLETDMRSFKHWDIIESIFLAIFLVEILFKMIVEGLLFFDPNEDDFLWNLFDLVIVGLGFFDLVATWMGISSSGGYATVFRMVRLLRVLRILRLLKVLKPLFLLAFGLIEACKAIIWVTLLMSFVLYILSIVLVKTVGEPLLGDPHYDFLIEHYHSIPNAMISLFVLMSSPNLPEYQNQEGLLDQRPLFTLFLIMFICFGSFGMIAMLTGVINESMFENNEMRKQERKLEHEMMRASLGERCAEIFETLPLDTSGAAKVEDFKLIAKQVADLLDMAGIQVALGDVVKFLELVDEDESGYIDMVEFVHAIERIAEGLSPLAIVEVQYYVNLCNKKLSGQMETVIGIEDKIEHQLMRTFDEVHRIMQAVCNGQEEHRTDVIDKIESQMLRTSEEVDRILTAVTSDQHQHRTQVIDKMESQMLHTVEEVERILQAVTSDQHQHRTQVVDKIESQMLHTVEEVDRILQVVTSDQNDHRAHLVEKIQSQMEKVEAQSLRIAQAVEQILKVLTGDETMASISSAGAQVVMDSARDTECPSEIKGFETILLAAVSKQTEDMVVAVQSAIDKRFSYLERTEDMTSALQSAIDEKFSNLERQLSLKDDHAKHAGLAVSSQMHDISASLQTLLHEADSRSRLDEIVCFIQDLNRKVDMMDALRSDITRLMQEPKASAIQLVKAQDATNEEVDLLQRKGSKPKEDLNSCDSSSASWKDGQSSHIDTVISAPQPMRTAPQHDSDDVSDGTGTGSQQRPEARSPRS